MCRGVEGKSITGGMWGVNLMMLNTIEENKRNRGALK